MRILLAEDNLTNQKLVLRQLEVLNYSADVVADGQAAVDAVMQSSYDLVLMDCQMPVLDGFEATLAIRQWESQHSPTRKTIVVAMTASDLKQDRDRARAVGMDDYLVKPVRKETLAELLTRWGKNAIGNATDDASKQTNNTSGVSNQLTDQLANDKGVTTQRSQSAEPFRPVVNHLDWSYLHQLSDHNPEFELELLQLFIQDSQSQLENLRQAMTSQNFLAIEQIAHHIKGASANVGAKLMQIAAAQIEEKASQKQANGFQVWLTAIEVSLLQIRQLLLQKS